MSSLQGLEPLGLEEYDTPDIQGTARGDDNRNNNNEDLVAADATQMEENLGVEDLGVDDVLQTKVRRPQPKLDAKRLLNPHRGYPFLLEHLKKIPYRGRGDEKRYLKKYVNTYLIWANRLWPKANFDDFTVLARKAGKDTRVRQYCRELIEEEKYGGQQSTQLDTTTHAPMDAASTNVPAEPRPTEPRPTEPRPTEPRPTELRPTEHASDVNTQKETHVNLDPEQEHHREAASPPPEWEFHAASVEHGSPPPEDFGPDEDEEAAAMELYGDLDM